MPGAHGLGGQIAAILGIDRRMQRHAPADLDAGAGKAVQLGRIVGQQHDAAAAEQLQHARRDPIVALIVLETERHIGIDRVEAGILQPIRLHLVGEAEPAPLLVEVEDDAARVLDAGNRKLELIAAIAAPRPEHVPGQAGRVQPDEHRLGEIGLPDDDRGRAAADAVPEHDELRLLRAFERHAGGGGDPQRFDELLPEPPQRFGLHAEQQARVRQFVVGIGRGDQQCRQTLRELGKLDRRDGRGAHGDRRDRTRRGRRGGKRMDRIEIFAAVQRQRDRSFGVDAEGASAPGRDREPQRQRIRTARERADEAVQALGIKRVDRHRDHAALGGEQNRPAGTEFGKAPFDCHLCRQAEQTGNQIRNHVLRHFASFLPGPNETNPCNNANIPVCDPFIRSLTPMRG